jgi:hypothetical protein
VAESELKADILATAREWGAAAQELAVQLQEERERVVVLETELRSMLDATGSTNARATGDVLRINVPGYKVNRWRELLGLDTSK